MFKKKIKSMISVCLVLSLFLNVIGAEQIEKPLINDKEIFAEIYPEDKITPQLTEVMQKSTKNEKVPVSIWLQDIDQESIDDDFKDDSVIVVLNRDVSRDNERDFTAEDFSDIGAVYVRDLIRLADWENEYAILGFVV